MTRLLRSGPIMTLSVASSISCAPISFKPRRADSRAASLARLARSAPLNPGVSRAMISRSMPSARGLSLVWTFRMACRSRMSGRSMTICRSNRPGLSNAGSRMSGRLVAATTITLAFVSKPSISDEYLVEGLLALVMSPADTCAAVAPNGVNLVNEDDARRVALRLLEQVAHSGCTDADEHLDEFTAADGVEGHLCLARDGLRQQRLARSGRANQQYAARNAATKRLGTSSGDFRNSTISSTSSFASSVPATSAKVIWGRSGEFRRARLLPKLNACEPAPRADLMKKMNNAASSAIGRRYL